MCRLVLTYAALIHVYTGLFLRAYIFFFSLCMCKILSMYMYRILHMQGLSCVCIAPGRNPNLAFQLIFPPFFHLFAILPSFFITFALNCMFYITFHPILHPISLSHHFLHLILNLLSFFLCRFQPYILVGVALVGSWCGTPS